MVESAWHTRHNKFGKHHHWGNKLQFPGIPLRLERHRHRHASRRRQHRWIAKETSLMIEPAHRCTHLVQHERGTGIFRKSYRRETASWLPLQRAILPFIHSIIWRPSDQNLNSLDAPVAETEDYRIVRLEAVREQEVIAVLSLYADVAIAQSSRPCWSRPNYL